ncbi:hypothetical protein I4U23_018169 [Adineta vaga]|nr:hypothetical protein I4U23_018169 [Adineta vaga]
MSPSCGSSTSMVMIITSTIKLRFDEESKRESDVVYVPYSNPVTTTYLLRINEDRKQTNVTLHSGESAENKDLVPSIHRIFAIFELYRFNSDDCSSKMDEDVSTDDDDVIKCTDEIDDECRLQITY